MKEYAPRKVFILENGEYNELTNEEFEHRKVTDPMAELVISPNWRQARRRGCFFGCPTHSLILF